MKKDKKFLLELENELNSISKKQKDAIILKYRNIIDEELNKKRKIKEILKEIGTPKSVAEKEIEEIKKENKLRIIKEKIIILFEKTKDIIVKIGKSISTTAKKIYKSITKDIQLKSKEEKQKIKDNKDKTKKVKNKKKKTKKEINFKEKIKKLFKKKKDKNVIKEVKEEIEETFDNVIEEVNEVTEIVTEKPIFLSKKERRKKLILRVLGLLLISIVIIIWLWIGILFVASLFALLDGVKLYGVNITLLGLDVLVLWIIIMLNKLIFKRKNNFKLNLIITLSSVFVIAVGISLTIYKLSKLEIVTDVSQKYNMTTKYDTYKMPSKAEDKMYIMFNSNYDTQYIVNYDNKLKGKFKVEVKYYENYYDYYIKKSSNNIYISLSRDSRDRISSYIDDFKENKIYKEEELSRYTVKITISEEDYQRLVIKN